MGLSIPNLNGTAVIGDESQQARASRGPAAYRRDPGSIRRGLVGCDLLAVVGIEDVDISSAMLYILLIPNSNQTPIRGPGQTGDGFQCRFWGLQKRFSTGAIQDDHLASYAPCAYV